MLACGIFIKNSDFTPDRYVVWGNIISLTGISLIILFPIVFLAILILFNTLYPVFYISMLFLAYAVCVAIIGCWLWGINQKFYISISLCGGLLLCLIVTMSFMKYNYYYENIPTIKENNVISVYAPFSKNSKVATLKDTSTLKLEKDLPILDGTDELYPVYSSFVKEVYPPPKDIENVDFTECEYLYCSSFSGAYKKIVDGDADIIFAGAPLAEQSKYADNKDVKLIYTPIGKEAFVFFVNAKNPINDLSTDEIKDIYSGKIKNWSDFGISELGEIRAFQRDDESVSQSILKRLMKGESLLKAPEEKVNDGMGRVIKKTADYRNYSNSIGF